MNPVMDTEEALKRLERENGDLKEQIRGIAAQQNELIAKLNHNETFQAALTNRLSNITPPSTPNLPPSQQGRHGSQPISKDIRQMIAKNVFVTEEMTYKEAAKTYGVSESSVYRIVKAEKKHKVDEDQDGQNEVQEPARKRRGRPSNLTVENLIFVLELLEENCQLTLNQMLSKLEEKFPTLSSSTSALDRELQKMDISWKMVMPILPSWNSYETLVARREYVTQLVFCNRPLVFIDESGFHMQTKRSKGRSLSGEPAVLTVLPKGNLILHILV
jgi:transposase